MAEEVRETVEEIPSPEEKLRLIEKIAMAHLIDKRLRTGEKALSGAMMHIHIARFIMDQLEKNPGDIREIMEKMENIWNKYYQRIFRHYKQAVVAPGRLRVPEEYRETVVEEEINKVLIEPEKRGVKGLVATAFMARKNGWRLKFPKAEEDVEKGIDLTILRGIQSVPLQIKCPESQEELEVRRRGSKVWVRVPAASSFYVVPELGIPRSKNVRNFGELLNKQLNKGGG